ncbi:MAG: hypothetical protein Ta2E_09960 [Mycoplasmoidaceae bacterium]|nr:MAG: hypothetical protein Ta2E_09960 [Mycoplasmoidaceae bacterium]
MIYSIVLRIKQEGEIPTIKEVIKWLKEGNYFKFEEVEIRRLRQTEKQRRIMEMKGDTIEINPDKNCIKIEKKKDFRLPITSYNGNIEFIRTYQKYFTRDVERIHE